MLNLNPFPDLTLNDVDYFREIHSRYDHGTDGRRTDLTSATNARQVLKEGQQKNCDGLVTAIYRTVATNSST